MTSILAFTLVYIVGGITFIPLLLLVAFFSAPVAAAPTAVGSAKTSKDLTQDEEDLTGYVTDAPDKLKAPAKSDVCAGYFAVCREYVPGGVNGKPPERTTPAGEIVATGSPSVYQSMYRSIFDRNRVQGQNVVEGNKNTRKARNVFYVVLRHGHLVLFDDSEQLEVRHVIALANYKIDLYAGGQDIPEGELWIKRNCIRLVKNEGGFELQTAVAPFYLFSDNCSEKEDFYHELIQHQARESNRKASPPQPLHFETEDMVKLVRQLHESEENIQSRWINALIGRVFLALYKTAEIENIVRQKINKKIARVSKPAFISSVQLQEVDMGDSAPLLTNPKLKELTVDGNLLIEADVKYNGKFKIQIAAVARIDLGSRFKAREVDLVLAGIFKKLEGKALFRIKPPPSNRVWFTFESMPKMDLTIEPIVSSRQITYGFILRAIESRVREVFGETLVLPNWDDIAFIDTHSQEFRGGLWEFNKVPVSSDVKFDTVTQDASSEGLPSTTSDIDDALVASLEGEKDLSGRTESQPTLWTVHQRSRSGGWPQSSPPKSGLRTSLTEQVPRPDEPEKPKALRSNSFATAAIPIVSRGAATIEKHRPSAKARERNAAEAMKIISNRSAESSPATSPVGSPKESRGILERNEDSYTSLPLPSSSPMDSHETTIASIHRATKSIASSLRSSQSTSSTPTSDSTLPTDDKEEKLSRSNTDSPTPTRKPINESLSAATAAAKKWGFGVLARQNELKLAQAKASQEDISSKTFGRGQPLPPPGTPLPRPASSGWSVPNLGVLKKKVESSPSSNGDRSSRAASIRSALGRTSVVSQGVNGSGLDDRDDKDDSLMVITAPTDSTPTTPSVEKSSPFEAKPAALDTDNVSTPQAMPISTQAEIESNTPSIPTSNTSEKGNVSEDDATRSDGEAEAFEAWEPAD